MGYGNGGAISGGGPTYKAPIEPMGESGTVLRDRLGAVEEQVANLHGQIEALEKRLDAVLAPVPPTTATEAATSPPNRLPCSHVVGRVMDLRDVIESAVYRLGVLSQRIEL